MELSKRKEKMDKVNEVFRSTWPKHTPGPWHFHGDGMERKRDDGKTPALSYNVWSGNLETGENLFNLAEVCIPIHGRWGDKTAVANAHLIAAAPELLQALEDLFKHCAMIHKIWGSGCNQKEADAAVQFARAAMDKARGITS